LTANVKRLIEGLFFGATWVDAGHGYEGAESELKLDGWNRSRRVIVTRRLIKDNLVLTDDHQVNFVLSIQQRRQDGMNMLSGLPICPMTSMRSHNFIATVPMRFATATCTNLVD
jgi:hypothetical protein